MYSSVRNGHVLYALTYLVLLNVVLWRTVVHAASDAPSYCQFVRDAHFDKCGNETIESDIHSQNRAYNINTSRNPGQNNQNDDGVCINDNICRRVFNVTRILKQSFSKRTLKKLSEMLKDCCGSCAKYHLSDTHLRISHLTKPLLAVSDIIYPVIGQSSLKGLHDFYFVPVFEVPNALFFTLKMSKTEMAINIAKSCLGMWPLLTVCCLLSFVAGFICWAMETPTNSKEFPRHFCVGVFDGFWWSIVTMTTVGFGDKSPKSPWGRMFAVIWIAVGISICSIYCASLTTEIMNLRSPEEPSLNGRLIGGLRYRVHDKMMIAQHGGILHAIDFNDTVFGVAELIRQLEKKEIDGFLINRETYYHFSRAIMEKEKYKHVVNHMHLELTQTAKYYHGEKIVTGLLVKDKNTFDYFSRYFHNNWLEIQTCRSYTLNQKGSRFDSHSYVRLTGLFHQFLYWSLGVLGVIGSFGIVYEICRRYFPSKTHKLKKSDERIILRDENQASF